MRVKFLRDGESPDIGVFTRNESKLLPESLAQIFIARGLAEEVKPNKPKAEVRPNGK